jgi:hypothetical protein
MSLHSYIVTSAADTTGHGTLRSAILYANGHPGTTITFAANLAHHTITLLHELPLILGNHTVIDGNRAPHLTISGHDKFRVFFVGDASHNVSATIENLTISHALAKGGDGGSGASPGGAGAGLGGAIFVSSDASLVISGLRFSADAADGGNGGGAGGAAFGGGGGMGGNGGAGDFGGIFFGDGGGGGFGIGANGGNASSTGTSGGGGQFTNGAGGGSAGNGSGTGGANGGGGAGGSTGSTGGNGGGGGAGGQKGSPRGDGGFGGGGGGGGTFGGLGGYGGGGGGGGSFGFAGGFAGGGGGGSGSAFGGFGGGQGSAGGGGGGGMGGAIFVMGSGSLFVRGAVSINGNAVMAGNGTAGAESGQAFGVGLFLNGSGTISFAPGSGIAEKVSNAIDDEAGVVANGYHPFLGFMPGSYGLIKSGLGALVLSAANAYSGATTVKAGTLTINGSIVHSTTTVDAHATLSGHGTTGNITVLGGGILSPGGGTAILHTGNLVLDPHAHFVVQLGGANPGPHGYDQLDVIGTVNLTGAKLDLSLLGAFHGHNGETFEIINNDGIDPVTGHFAGLAEGAHVVAGGKVFSVSYHGGDGNDVVLTEHGNAFGLHHASAMMAGDWLFA